MELSAYDLGVERKHHHDEYCEDFLGIHCVVCGFGLKGLRDPRSGSVRPNV